MQASHPQTVAVNDLAEAYSSVRTFTEKLCVPLEIEDYIPQPSVDVSPPKWNIAHTTWFFEEMILKKFGRDYEIFDEQFGFLFNSYYNSIGERTSRDHRGDLSRPTVKRVFEYRKYVDAAMAELLSGEIGGDLRELVILGLNHEQQHQELFLTDLKYTFSLNPLFPVYDKSYSLVEKSDAGKGEFLQMEAGDHEIGFTGEGFCFDNELSRHRVFLDKFEIRDSLVTNREFLEFIEDGAYRDPLLWHSEGWDWVNQNKVDSPLYWHEREGKRFNYTLAGLKEIELDAPVCHVSFYEASAFAEWKGMRLPTEFEWEAANGRFEWGLRWEWTNSAYLPYPGFSKPNGAVGEYNGKFMINQMVFARSVSCDAGGPQSKHVSKFLPPAFEVAVYGN